ncbi:hypothetical protein ACJA23_03145 [Mycoplasma corogypsi]|uniref:hypothetical protein n=1 Tax=Mycoplasma corogypsi TaxID=2106 RepID=UPI00387346DA
MRKAKKFLLPLIALSSFSLMTSVAMSCDEIETIAKDKKEEAKKDESAKEADKIDKGSQTTPSESDSGQTDTKPTPVEPEKPSNPDTPISPEQGGGDSETKPKPVEPEVQPEPQPEPVNPQPEPAVSNIEAGGTAHKYLQVNKYVEIVKGLSLEPNSLVHLQISNFMPFNKNGLNVKTVNVSAYDDQAGTLEFSATGTYNGKDFNTGAVSVSGFLPPKRIQSIDYEFSKDYLIQNKIIKNELPNWPAEKVIPMFSKLKAFTFEENGRMAEYNLINLVKSGTAVVKRATFNNNGVLSLDLRQRIQKMHNGVTTDTESSFLNREDIRVEGYSETNVLEYISKNHMIEGSGISQPRNNIYASYWTQLYRSHPKGQILISYWVVDPQWAEFTRWDANSKAEKAKIQAFTTGLKTNDLEGKLFLTQSLKWINGSEEVAAEITGKTYEISGFKTISKDFLSKILRTQQKQNTIDKLAKKYIDSQHASKVFDTPETLGPIIGQLASNSNPWVFIRPSSSDDFHSNNQVPFNPNNYFNLLIRPSEAVVDYVELSTKYEPHTSDIIIGDNKDYLDVNGISMNNVSFTINSIDTNTKKINITVKTTVTIGISSSNGTNNNYSEIEIPLSTTQDYRYSA